MDGVLIDSCECMELAWQEVQNELDISTEFAQYKKRIGIPFYNIISELGLKSVKEDIKKVSMVINRFTA